MQALDLDAKLGTPQAIYERPANRFVASFVGSPAMNFVPGRLSLRDGCARFEGPGFGLELGAASPSPSVAAERAITLGVRPEHVRVVPEGDRGVPATIELVEPMGADSLVWLRAGAAALSARVAGLGNMMVGARVAVSIAPEQISIFDDATGERVAAAEPVQAPPRPSAT